MLCNIAKRGITQNFNIINTVFAGGSNSDTAYICLSSETAATIQEFKSFLDENYVYLLYEIAPIETILTEQQVKALYDLRTYYGGTNITYQSENGTEPVVNFDYACAMDAFVEYVKEQQGDTREMIYDMDDRLTQAEVTALEAAIDTQIMAAMMEV